MVVKELLERILALAKYAEGTLDWSAAYRRDVRQLGLALQSYHVTLRTLVRAVKEGDATRIAYCVSAAEGIMRDAGDLGGLDVTG